MLCYVQQWNARAGKTVDPLQFWDPNCLDRYMHWYDTYGKPRILPRPTREKRSNRSKAM